MPTLQHDNYGFLTGDSINLDNQTALLQKINADVRIIRNALTGVSNRNYSNSSNRNQIEQISSPRVNRSLSAVNDTRFNRTRERLLSNADASENPRIEQQELRQISQQQAQNNTNQARVLDRLQQASNQEAAQPVQRLRDANGRFISSNRQNAVEVNRDDSNLGRNRDANGRFSSNGGNSNGLISNAVDKLSSAIHSLSFGTGDVERIDPAIAAMKEISEPISHIFGGGWNLLKSLFPNRKRDGSIPFLKKIWNELKLTRKQESTYNQTQRRLLRNISENHTVNNSGGSGFLGGLLGGAIPVLLAGVLGFFGLLFTPLALGIGVAAIAAWGLFSENGHKFFENTFNYVSTAWDLVTKIAGDVFKDVKTNFDSAVSSISTMFDSVFAFIKDKLGIDIPKAFHKAVDTVNNAVDAAANTKAGKAVGNVVEGVVNKAKDVGGSVIDKAKEVGGNLYQKTKDFVTGDSPHKRADERAKVVMKTLMEEGFTKEQAAGIAGNFNVESGGFSDKILTGKVRGDKHMKDTAIGLAQWRGEREDAIVKHFGKPIGEMSLEEQTKAAVWEMRDKKGGEQKAYKKIKDTKTAEESAAVTDKSFERSDGKARQERMRVAGHFYNLDLNDSKKPVEPIAKAESNVVIPKTISENEKTVTETPKLEDLGDGQISVTNPETGVTELATPEQTAKYQSENTPEKIAARKAAWTESQAPFKDYYKPATASLPQVPTSPKIASVPAIQDAPIIKEPLNSRNQNNVIQTSLVSDIGQDISDKRLAHIVSGGYAKI